MCSVAARDLRAQDQKQATHESALDRAVRALDAAESKTEGSPDAARPDSVPAPSSSAAEPQGNVLQSFFASWDLFHNSYLVGWLVGLLLSLVGVVVDLVGFIGLFAFCGIAFLISLERLAGMHDRRAVAAGQEDLN